LEGDRLRWSLSEGGGEKLKKRFYIFVEWDDWAIPFGVSFGKWYLEFRIGPIVFGY